jgi:putative FmdB family regulatory protein
MPIYEYRCPKCGHQFEKIVRFSEAEKPQPCDNKDCDEAETKRLISASNFQLKGGGWYRDGYSG